MKRNSRIRLFQGEQFQGLSSLETLVLKDNSLEWPLPATLFNGLRALRTLDLRSNYLSASDIQSGALLGMPRLQLLRLSKNRLLDLDAGVFAELPSLLSIELDHNLLRDLPAGMFAHQVNLTALALCDNDFAGKPSALAHLPASVVLEGLGIECRRATRRGTTTPRETGALTACRARPAATQARMCLCNAKTVYLADGSRRNAQRVRQSAMRAAKRLRTTASTSAPT